MNDFSVKGPFDVPWIPRGKGRIVDTAGLNDFWNDQVGSELQKARGCYVFGMRAGKGIVPIYVGRATKNFKQECFTDNKLNKVNTSLLDWGRGASVLFLLPQAPKPGRTSMKLITTAEKFLIQNAIARNPDLANVHGTKLEDWGIRGVLRGGIGTPSAAARKFKRMMGL